MEEKYKIQGYRLKLVKERSVTYTLNRKKITSNEDVVAASVKLLGDSDREHVLCFWLNSNNQILGYQEVARGGLHGCVLKPSDILRGAIVSVASAIILVHNHPSDNPEPSEDDISMTRNLYNICEVLGIVLLDHVIVTPSGESCSMSLMGII